MVIIFSSLCAQPVQVDYNKCFLILSKPPFKEEISQISTLSLNPQYMINNAEDIVVFYALNVSFFYSAIVLKQEKNKLL